MKPESIIILSIFVGFAILEAVRTGFFGKKGSTRDDGIVELASGVMVIGFIKPVVVFTAAYLMSVLAPQYEGYLDGTSFIVSMLILLLCDDLMNYLWHRNAHIHPIFYKLHRPHHEGNYMSVRVVFRNGAFYYLLAPYYWLGGVLLFMGLGWLYAAFTVTKLLITIACHSDICWDRPLYKNKVTSPLMWIVERVIVTPAFHHAHHGKYQSDGNTHYKGNFGNLLSFWDVLFGTAKITREFPSEYGIEDLPATTIGEQLLWPVIRSSPAVVDHSKKK